MHQKCVEQNTNDTRILIIIFFINMQEKQRCIFYFPMIADGAAVSIKTKKANY